nr:PREDICTED: LOW QUALITY PROTEIN: apolipoprotein L3-like [Bos mutus]
MVTKAAWQRVAETSSPEVICAVSMTSAPISLHQEKAAHRAAGPTQTPGPFPGLGLAPGLCDGRGATWSAAGSPPLDRSPGALEQPVPHGPEQDLLLGRHAGPPEEEQDLKITDVIIGFQACCWGYLARRGDTQGWLSPEDPSSGKVASLSPGSSSKLRSGLVQGEVTPPSTMSSENLGHCSDPFEEVVECLWDILSREKLLLLLNEFLVRIKAEASLSREDTDEIHKYLNELKRVLVEEDQERLPKEQLDRRRILSKFPRVKRQLEEFIGKFHELADKVEKVHKGCTISNVMAHSTGAVSGILTIVGLALALMTMGSSVVLLATVTGLGAVGTVTSVSTSILEHMKRSSVETIASRMMSTLIKKWKVLLEILKSNPTTEKVTKAVQCIEMHIHDMQTGKAISDSAANILMGLMILSSPSIQKKEAVFKAPAFTITKGARAQIAGLAAAGVFLLVDVGFLVKESIHLHDGAKTEAAESLRQRAWELERKLEELTQIYESLQEDLS